MSVWSPLLGCIDVGGLFVCLGVFVRLDNTPRSTPTLSVVRDRVYSAAPIVMSFQLLDPRAPRKSCLIMFPK